MQRAADSTADMDLRERGQRKCRGNQGRKDELALDGSPLG
jgi:hypothetical protein